MAGGIPWAFVAGLLGNIFSSTVYFAPIPTFYRIYKKKTTEGFQSLPYVIALFSAMLWIYYAFVKTGVFLLITINSMGCIMETIFLAIYLTYAPSKAKIYTAKLILLLNVGLYSLIILLTLLLSKGATRLKIIGWVCLVFAFMVFVAPLTVVRQVIRTKSVEYMPFNMSMALTVSAVAWFAYGFFNNDYYVALPNILGFLFGAFQMVLYAIYRNKGKKDLKLPEHKVVDAPANAATVHGDKLNEEIELNAV